MLELKKVTFTVDDDDMQKDILKGVSLSVRKNEFIAITGPNGGGKSTLAKAIAGIIRPESGQILLDGRDITDWGITERARAGIGFAFQQPVRFKGVTIQDMITLAAGQELSVEEACHYLSEVGLCAVDYIDRELNASLSGGEMKRIEIAMLIARDPKLAVFDEPEAGIDLWSFHNLIRVFEHMRQVSDRAIVIISHQERILEIADRIVVMQGGEIKKIGAREEVLPDLLTEADTCRYYRSEVI